MPKCFNGAATKPLRKRRGTTPAKPNTAGFNGAATKPLRKPGGAGSAASCA